MRTSRIGQTILVATLMLFLGQSAIVLSITDSPTDGESFLNESATTFTGGSGTVFTGNGTQWQTANGENMGNGYSQHPISNDSFLFRVGDAGGNCLKIYSHSNLTVWNASVDSNYDCPGNPWLQYGPTIDNRVYISTTTQTSGIELFAYNITNNTLYLVEDINTGASSSTPYYLEAVGSTLYFRAEGSSATGNELWAYNTTNSTSWLVADINPGTGDGYPSYILPIGTSIVFVADDGTNGKELWTYETTNDSYWRVSDINPSGNGLNQLRSKDSAILGTRLMFWADDDGATGNELWAYETTNATHWQVADINSGSGDSYSTLMITRDGSRMYFSADDGINGEELWAYEATNDSVWLLADICSGCDSEPDEIAVMGNQLIFTATHTTEGRELFIYNFSNNTAWMRANFYQFSSNLASSYPEIIAVTGTQLLITAKERNFVDTVHPVSDYAKSLFVYETANDTIWWIGKLGLTTGSSSAYINGGTINMGTEVVFSLQCSGQASSACPNNQPGVFTLWVYTPSNVTIPDDFTPGGGHPDEPPTGGVGGVWGGGSSGGPGSCSGSGSGGYNLTASVEGADLTLGEAMSPITLNTPPPVSWETDPALPAGMSISNCIISGTPSVYANNQTYTVYANQSGNNTTIEMWFSVDSENPHTVVDGQAISAIGFHPPFWNGTTSWGIAPSLPENLSMDTLTGEITGIMNQTLTNTTFAVTATHSGSATQAFSFNLESLADFDGDGLPNQLPGDYNTAEPPTPGLIEDLDDDADGLPDLNETDTGNYVDDSDTGTDPLDPDSDDDGICDGPNAVPPICIAGPDPSPNSPDPPSISPASTTVSLTNDTAMAPITYNWVGGSVGSTGTYNGNGTAWMVADINSGGGSSPLDLTAVGTRIYFRADDGTNGIELWAHETTDGTTWMVADIRSTGSGLYYQTELVVIGTRIYFRADDGTNGDELWMHDITTNSTGMVADINSGGNSNIFSLTAMGTQIYFRADDGTNGIELWVYDTTTNSTWMVADINSGGSSSPYELTVMGTQIYFIADDGTYGREMWVYDTTTNSTWRITDLWPDSSNGGVLDGLTVIDTQIYFCGYDGTGNGYEMWVYDTTTNSTWPVTDINTGDGSWGWQQIDHITAIGSQLFFKQAVNSSGSALWVYDITSNSSWMIFEEADFISGLTADGEPFFAMGSRFYFDLDDGTSAERELWAYETTNNSTWMAYDVYPGSFGHGYPYQMVALDNRMYFSAVDPTGRELWAYDPSNLAISGPNNGPVTNATCEISPSLPAGLTLTQGTCTISGTPTVVQNGTNYTLWVNDSGVSDSVIVNITIDEFVPDPPSISPALTSVVLTNTTAMSPIEFTNSGGVIDTWEVYPSMPSGLTFDTSNGTISGTPTAIQNGIDYTVWANNTGGQSNATVNITIGELPPEFSYNESAINLTRLVSMDYLVPSVTGGPVETWEIEPVLPEGLEFSYGEISGIPLVNMTETTFTVWANNSGGSDSNTFTIIIVEPPEGLIASQTFALLVRDVAMYNILVNYIGGDIDTWEIEPPLPLGLTFDTENNVITGTPVDVMAETNYTIWANSSIISDSLIITLKVLEDTDGDGDPDDLGGVTWPALDEDLDDDADGISDVAEGNANPITDSLLPDTDGDGVCDGSTNVTIRGVDICTGGPDHFPDDPAADTDTDGDGDPDIVRDGFDTNLTEDLDDDNDGLPDENETAENSITDSLLPDTDGDGVCDGSINVTIRGEEICTGGPDAFPNDPAADTDTDGDGKPDELHGNSTTGLIEDLDDDGDQASDIAEIENGTDPKDPLDFPTDDADGDGWTDAQEDFCGTDKFDNSSVPSDYDEDKWCDADDPDDDNDGWFDDNEDACGTDPLDETSVPKDDDGNGICNSLEDSVPESDGDSAFAWWLCALFLLAIILILPLLLRTKDDAEPENTTVDPECESGTGAFSEPFILEPVKELEPGERILSKETFTITNISPGSEIKIIDLNEEENDNRFSMSDKLGNQENPAVIVADNEGTIKFRLAFDDADFLTYKGKECDALLKIGRDSVYMKWEVEIKADSEQVKKNADKSGKKKSSKKKSSKKKSVEEESAAEDAEKKSAKKKSVEEESAAEGVEKKATKPGKKKSAKAAEKKAVEEESAAEGVEKKSAKKKSVEEESAAEDVEKKSAKYTEKEEEMERIRANAANIDFDIIGVASESDKDDLQTIRGIGQFIEEKLNILGIYTYLQISKMSSSLEGEVNEAIEFFPGRIKRDQWVNQAKTLLGNDD